MTCICARRARISAAALRSNAARGHGGGQNYHHTHTRARHQHTKAAKLDADVARGLAIIRSAVSPVSPAYVAAVLAEGDALVKRSDERRAVREEKECVIAADKKGAAVLAEETAADPLWAELQRLRQAIDKFQAEQEARKPFYAQIQRSIIQCNLELEQRFRAMSESEQEQYLRACNKKGGV